MNIKIKLIVGLITLGLAGFTVYGIWAYGELFNNLDHTEKLAYAGVVPNVPIIDFFFEILAKMNHVVMVFLFNQQFHFVLFAIILTAGLIAGLTPYGISTNIFLTGQLHQEGISSRKKALFTSGLFSLGATFSLLLSGIGAALLGKILVNYSIAMYFPLVTLFMGLQMIGILKWINPIKLKLNQRKGASNAFLLGMPFGVVTPLCTAPIIVTILTLVASTGSDLLFGLLTLLTFAIGRSIPLIVISAYSDLLMRYLKPQHRRYGHMNKVLGGILILGSIYFLTWGNSYFGA